MPLNRFLALILAFKARAIAKEMTLVRIVATSEKKMVNKYEWRTLSSPKRLK